MSRRDSSRVHIAVRQSDSLAEFENFKKKFLFANKQITKQNCSLSLKIEELNTHISTLYVENLRLRASEIALQTELKREKLKCHKIMTDAEAATVNLLKHLGIIRTNYNVSAERSRSPKNESDNDSPPSSVRCQKPPPRSPSAFRFAALPSVPDIPEELEYESSPATEESNHNRVKGRTTLRRTSPSRLPQPSRSSSPPMTPLPSSSGDERMKRKLMRRPSGLVTSLEPVGRPISPVLGSPMQDAVNLSAEEEAEALQDVEEIIAREEEAEREAALRKARRRERARSRDNDEFGAIQEQKEKKEKKKASKDRSDITSTRLKDVTNSPRRKRSPTNTDSEDNNTVTRPKRPMLNISPQMMSSPAVDEFAYLPTPLPSSVANTPNTQHSTLPSSDAEANANAASRERRTRKSVNYAEPKLNTKMRKPDSIAPPGARPSLISAHSDPSANPSSSTANSNASTSTSLHRRSSSSPSPEVDPLDTARKNVAHRRSASSLASGSLASRPEKEKSDPNGAGAAASSNPTLLGLASKRKRLTRPYNDDDDDDDYIPSGSSRLKTLFNTNANSNGNGGNVDKEDESDDGGDADAEYAELRAWAGGGGIYSQTLGMGNVGSRRRNSSQVGAGVGEEGRGFSTRRGLRDIEDSRRHSMAA